MDATWRASALTRATQVVEHRDDGDLSTLRNSPDRDKYQVITLERGVMHDSE